MNSTQLHSRFLFRERSYNEKFVTLAAQTTTAGHQQSHNKSFSSSVIVHIGSAKTFTTPIQHFLAQAHEALLADGYENFPNGDNLAACFFKKDTSSSPRIIKMPQNRFPCDHHALDHAKDIASEKQLSMILSAEKMDTFHQMNLTHLSKFLNHHWSHDRVTIVMFYRRIYDLAMSWYEERFLEEPVPMFQKNKSAANNIRYIPSKSKFLKQTSLGAIWHKRGALELWNHYSKYFDNVQVVNMHDNGTADPVETMMCQVLPRANHTCQMYNTMNKTKKENMSTAATTTLEYRNLAFAARQMGIVDENADLEALQRDIQFHQEHVLNRTVYDFPLECPSLMDLESLLLYSCVTEKMLFPEFFASPLGEISLRADFRRKSETILCDVDLKATLGMMEWQDFFQNFSQKVIQ